MLSSKNGGQILGPILGAAGTDLLPTYSFTLDPNTGLFSGGADVLGISVGGTSRLTIETAKLTSTIVFRLLDGVVGAPAYTFDSETSAGYWRVSAGITAISGAGIEIVRFKGTGGANPQALFQSGTAGLPGISFATDATTGLMFDGSLDSDLGLVSSTVLVARVSGARSAIEPEANNVFALGSSARKWTTLWSVTLDTGDINMRDPSAVRGDKEAAHWKLVEGVDGIFAYNIRSGKKFSLAMKAEAMTADDEARIASQRRAHGWDD